MTASEVGLRATVGAEPARFTLLSQRRSSELSDENFCPAKSEELCGSSLKIDNCSGVCRRSSDYSVLQKAFLRLLELLEPFEKISNHNRPSLLKVAAGFCYFHSRYLC